MKKKNNNNKGSNYSDGNEKDIMIEDILVDTYIRPVTKEKTCFAYIALFPFSNKEGLKRENPKFYFGSGDTEIEARDNLLNALIGDLLKIKSTKRFP